MRKTGARKGEKKGQHKKMSGEKEMGKDLKKERTESTPERQTQTVGIQNTLRYCGKIILSWGTKL